MMGPTRLDLGCLLVLCALSLLVSFRARAAEDPVTVLLLAPEEQVSTPRYLDLLQAVQARLAASAVQVRMQPMAELIGEQSARSAALQAGAVTVAWLAEDAGHFLLLTPGVDHQPRARSLTGEGEGWVTRCEVMAVILHSELQQAVGTGAPAMARVTGGAEKPAALESAPSDARMEGPEAPPGEAPAPVALLISAGYAPALVQPWQAVMHGVQACAAVRFGSRWQLRLAADLAQRVQLAPSPSGRLLRLPLQLALAASFPRGRLEPSAELGTALELWKVSDLGYEPADPSVQDWQADAGITLTARARYWLRPWLAPYIEAGLGFFFRQRRVTLLGDALLERRALLPSLGAGLAFQLPAR